MTQGRSGWDATRTALRRRDRPKMRAPDRASATVKTPQICQIQGQRAPDRTQTPTQPRSDNRAELALVPTATERFKPDWYPPPSEPQNDPPEATKKAAVPAAPWDGSDGTRTRDLRRDRPAL